MRGGGGGRPAGGPNPGVMYAVTLPCCRPPRSPPDWAAASAGSPRSPARPPRGSGGCVTHPAFAPARTAAAAAREETGKPLAECCPQRAVSSTGRELVPAPEGGGSVPRRACPRWSSEWGCCWAVSPGKSSPEGLLHLSTSRQPRAPAAAQGDLTLEKTAKLLVRFKSKFSE